MELQREVRNMVDQLLGGNDLSAPPAAEDEITAWTRRSRTVESVSKLPGDASTRKYYRIVAREPGGAKRTYILMRMESFAELGEKLNFLVVRNHLAASGVDVPEVLDLDAERGTMLLEDLGDVTLLRRLQEVSSADVERHLYERVIDSLVQLQVAASPKRRPADIEAYKLRFDHEKLFWEMTNTIEHFYQLYLKRRISDADMKTMREGFSEICTYLANRPTVLAHRDFHSRNLMIPALRPGEKQERLVMIDFQDARLGPAQYDLASLLRDSYYQLEEAQITRLIDYYIARWEAMSGEKLDRAEFNYTFDMMAVQRNFKAIGSFASFLNKRGDATYLKYVGNTFENIRRTLLKYPQYSNLREVLFHYYYF